MGSYDMLKSRVKEGENNIFDILNVNFSDVIKLPIQVLELPENLKMVLASEKVYADGKYISKFTTLGDLVDFGYEKTKDLLQNNFRASELLNILQEVQEQLAKFALKLKGTDFTVFDIRISKVNMSGKTRAWAEKNNIETLGDIYLLGTERINAIVKEEKGGSKIKNDLVDALHKYGTKPERTDARDRSKIDSEPLNGITPKFIEKYKNEFFPNILLYVSPISEEKNGKGKEVETLIQAQNLAISPSTSSASVQSEDFKSKIRKPVHIVLKRIHSALNPDEIRMFALMSKDLGTAENSESETRPNRASQEEIATRVGQVQNAGIIRNVEDAPNKAMFEMSVSKLALKPRVHAVLAQKLGNLTIGELTFYSKKQLLIKGLSETMTDQIEDALAIHGLKLEGSRRKIIGGKLLNNNYTLTPEQIAAREEKQSKADKEIAEAAALGISVHELRQKKKKENTAKVAAERWKKYREAIEKRNAEIDAQEEAERAKYVTLTESQITKLKNLSGYEFSALNTNVFSVFGINEKSKQTLVQLKKRKGVTTVSDLIKFGRYLLAYFNGGGCTVNMKDLLKIEDILAYYGLMFIESRREIVDRKIVRSERFKGEPFDVEGEFEKLLAQAQSKPNATSLFPDLFEPIDQMTSQTSDHASQFVSSSFGSGVARVKPVHSDRLLSANAFNNEEQKNVEEDKPTTSGGSGNKPKGTKFHHGENGWARKDYRVHKFSTHSEFEIQDDGFILE